MFFPRLRRQAKWVFVFLAVAFAASFVLFGVGTGFGGLQDILLQERAVDGGPSEEEARERIQRNPNDAQAYYDLATALQTKGEVDESIPPLAKYVRLRPSDGDAQRELAGLYLRQAEQYRLEAQTAQLELQRDVPGTTFEPLGSSKIGQALGNDPLDDALAARHNERLTNALTKLQQTYMNAVGVYKRLARAEPNDASLQFELAQTAEAANDLPTALAAYRRFVALAPEDPSAQAVRQRIEQLEAGVPRTSGG